MGFNGCVFKTPHRPFPTEESVEDQDIYNHLEDLIECVQPPPPPTLPLSLSLSLSLSLLLFMVVFGKY